MAKFKSIWNSKNIKITTKLDIFRTCVMSVVLYACETWTLKKRDKERLLAFEMKCYRRILHIWWEQKISNVEVRRRVGNTKNIVGVIMRRKLCLFGHICRMGDNRLLKSIVFGRMDGTSVRGRPCREWLDDIKEWCNEDIYILSRKAQNRDLWKRIVKNASDTNGR